MFVEIEKFNLQKVLGFAKLPRRQPLDKLGDGFTFSFIFT